MADCDKPLFPDGVIGVIEGGRQSIIEYSSGFVKGHPMFPMVPLGLFTIPLKSHSAVPHQEALLGGYHRVY